MVLTQERHGLLKTDCQGERIPEKSVVGGDNKSPQTLTSKWSAFIIGGEFYDHFVSIILNIDHLIMTNQGITVSLGSVWVPASCDNPSFFLFFTCLLKQSGSSFTLAPEFSVVTRQMTSEYQQHFAVYDVKQWSKWNAFSIFSPFAA